VGAEERTQEQQRFEQEKQRRLEEARRQSAGADFTDQNYKKE
jgi:hypothetical protein